MSRQIYTIVITVAHSNVLGVSPSSGTTKPHWVSSSHLQAPKAPVAFFQAICYYDNYGAYVS